MNLKLNVLASFICYNARVSGIDIKLKGAADWSRGGGGNNWGNKKGPSSLSTEAPVTSSPTDSPTGAPVTSPPTMGSNDAKDGTKDGIEYGGCINDAPTDTTNAVLIKFVDNPYEGETGKT